MNARWDCCAPSGRGRYGEVLCTPGDRSGGGPRLARSARPEADKRFANPRGACSSRTTWQRPGRSRSWPGPGLSVLTTSLPSPVGSSAATPSALSIVGASMARCSPRPTCCRVGRCATILAPPCRPSPPPVGRLHRPCRARPSRVSLGDSVPRRRALDCGRPRLGPPALCVVLAPGLTRGRAECCDFRRRSTAAAVLDDLDLCRLLNPGGPAAAWSLGLLEIIFEQLPWTRLSPFRVDREPWTVGPWTADHGRLRTRYLSFTVHGPRSSPVDDRGPHRRGRRAVPLGPLHACFPGD